MGLMADGTARKPVSEEANDGEAYGDEGVGKVTFRPQA